MKTKENTNNLQDKNIEALSGVEIAPPKKKKRSPSESSRLQKSLDVMHKAGLAPQSVRFHHEGGFEVILTESPATKTDEFELWLKDEMEGTE